MYGTSHSSVSAPMNGIGGDLVDGSGTINPAALNNSVAVVLPAPYAAAATTLTPLPRGVKRSRTPDSRGNARADGDHDDADDHGRRKRGRPPKTPRPSTANTHEQPHSAGAHVQTPRMQTQPLPPHAGVTVSPPQASPPEKTTPTKTTLVKALPTVRDHTTDQLNEEGDEYIPKEFDEAGEKKVDAMGYPQGNREYKCRTFRVPLRGTKLFMLATECARVLGYRDSYLLFNKNRSLHKIIATQIEKDDLIAQDILPYSYRSRQIAIVTAKSMFRQFGSRVIVNGRRVRDDYWESKARKQGFTEEDLAGEKRPGGSKARDAAAAEAASAANLLPALAHGDVIYSNALEAMPNSLPLGPPSSVSHAPLPMIHMATTTDDPRLREYNSMPRARQELTGQPYQDRSQPSSAADILNQASHTADFNKILSSQRSYRQKGLEDFYAKQREIPQSAAQSQPGQLDTTAAAVSQPIQSPQMPPAGVMNSTQPQQPMLAHQPPPMMPGQSGFQPPAGHHHQPPPPVGQSPVRAMPPVRPDLMHQRSNPAMSGGGTPQPQGPYGFPSQPQQMWGQPPPQPQPSPMPASGPQGVPMPQYASQLHAQQQHSPSPLAHSLPQQPHPSQSPRNQPRPSVAQMPQSFPLHHPHAPQQQPMASMGFPGNTAAPYPSMAARGMYPSTQGPGGQPFMAGTPQQPGMAMGMSAGGGIPGWSPQPGAPMQPGHPQPGQSGAPLGWTGY